MNTKTILTTGTVVLLVMALAGCAHNGPYGGHSEKWYAQHKTAMKAEAKWCKSQALARNMNSCVRIWQALAPEGVH